MSYTNGLDNPELYFNTVQYTGNKPTGQSVTGVGFQPDWYWSKNTPNTGYNHSLIDSVRGVSKILSSNNTNAELTSTDSLTSFDSDGFTLGADANGYVNQQPDNHVAWCWKAGTSASGNTTGSGTAQSYTASASTTAGFSITAFTGNGTANHTLPHNLGVAPDWFIIKKRIGTGDSTVRDWNVYHKSLGNTKRIALNSTGAVSTSSEYWNDTSPTSSVINLGTNDQINGNNNTYICYAFAEKKGYSKFGSYTGNGLDTPNGVFTYLGFTPAFILIKATDDNSWVIVDNKRPADSNPVDSSLAADSNAAETTGDSNTTFDFLSNGFRTNGNSGNNNSSGQEYIYMAFAESPLVNSNGVPTNAR